MDIAGLLDPIIKSSIFKAASLGTGVICLLFAFAMIFWMYRDARRRAAVPLVWTAIALTGTIGGMMVGFPFSQFGFGPVGIVPFGLMLFLSIIYMIIRPSEFKQDTIERDMSIRLLDAELETTACPTCGAGIEGDFLICPECLHELRHACEYCGRPVKKAWQACPYCKSRQGVPAAPSPSLDTSL